jgi:hypothetical protein
MLSRTKILVVDQDINSLSKIYLNLLHRNCLKRLKPSILIIHHEFYKLVEKNLKIPAIILTDKFSETGIREQEDLKILNKPVQADQLLFAVKSLEI